MATEPKGHMGVLGEARVILRRDNPLPLHVNQTFATGSSLRSTESEQVVRKQIHDNQFHLKEEDFSQLRRR